MMLAIVKVLPVPVAPSMVWRAQALLEAADELLDGAGLVAGGLEVGDELEAARGTVGGWFAHAFKYTG